VIVDAGTIRRIAMHPNYIVWTEPAVAKAPEQEH
jgi:hypothetical protein